jgi:hypothetical protein
MDLITRKVKRAGQEITLWHSHQFRGAVAEVEYRFGTSERRCCSASTNSSAAERPQAPGLVASARPLPPSRFMMP